MLNQVVLVGRLTSDLEAKELEDGKKVTNMTLAIPRSFKNADGEYETLFAVLGNPNIPKSRKMAIFRTSFANIDYELLGEEEKENLVLARDEALRLINLKDEKTFSKGQVQGIKRKKGNGKRFNEYTSDPQLR